VGAVQGYRPAGYDEMLTPAGDPRAGARVLWESVARLPPAELAARQARAAAASLEQGITFTLYGDELGTERIFPLDVIPRPVMPGDWQRLTRGIVQRVRALNLFLADVYGPQRVLAAGRLPADLVLGSRLYRRALQGVEAPRGIYTHVAGIDLVRDGAGNWLVLEDNLRTPSGVSYLLTNRQIMTRIFPPLFARMPVRSVDHYPDDLLEVLRSIAPSEAAAAADGPTIAVLTPGIYNSAYFEHSFLAKQMGVELVEGRDLVVRDAVLYMRTTRGLRRVDVLYRRVDDDYLDPLVFRWDSLLGSPGLVQACRVGNLALANAMGTGLADDKAIYAYVPALIRYYLGEAPLLEQVETHVLADPNVRERVLADLRRYVVKSVNESGGYGMLMGPEASPTEIEACRERILADPRSFVAQPRIELSTCPCFIDGAIVPRRVDLRVFALYGADVRVVPGGLTRVALREGSYVVNSSQGGGSKDTWVPAASAGSEASC
jgi:uncharacterized circularly permuted ATP-grasp superfamily protein